MEIQIKTTEKELPIKKEELVKAISQLIGKVDPELKDSLLKALPGKNELFSDPVQLEILKQWEMGYKEQTYLMLKDIEKVLDKKPKIS